jgi:hypothetical protein
MTQRPIYKHIPFFILILALLIFGLFTFRDYGLSWDEPLFYDYGEALGYAYTPSNWFRADFDLNNAYGPSADDHKTRGPAYLLLARTPVHLLESLGIDAPSAWHLVNFLTFLLGVYFVYRLSLRWMGEWAAFGAAALFSTQPLLLGHAFINPKDMPFLVFFTGALLFGFEMVDGTFSKTKSGKHKMLGVFVAAFFLGIATSIRVLAPLAGILVTLYFLVGRTGSPPNKAERNTTSYSQSIPLHKKLLWIFLYTTLTILFMLASWPYLWEAPLKNFFQVFLFMSDNPTGLQVLFSGEVYRAFELPHRYLPTLLGITLTESVWPLFILGGGFAIWRTLKFSRSKVSPEETLTAQGSDDLIHRPLLTEHWSRFADYWLTLLAFVIPFAYVLILHPPMYDGFRHFLFILAPVFVTCGFGLEAVFTYWENQTTITNYPKDLPMNLNLWLRMIFFLLTIPGFMGITNLHPYEYTYYNSFVGGTGGAFRTYETDYWLTCYKQAVEQVNALAPANLFVHREAYIAAGYAADGITVRDERGNLAVVQSGDYILVNTRTNEDRKTFHDAPAVIQIGRGGATFCVVKQVP